MKHDWLYRTKQIEDLFAILRSSVTAAIFVHGPPATGKTGVVRMVASALGHKALYVDCNERPRQQQIVQGIMSQIKGRKRCKTHGYESGANGNDFLAQLAEAASAGSTPCLLILDNIERISDTSFLAVLQRLPEQLDIPLSLVLISQLPWGSEKLREKTTACWAPFPVHFTQYNEDEAKQIVLQRIPSICTDVAAYKALVEAAWVAIWRHTRNVRDQHKVLLQLLPIYLKLWKCHGGNVRAVAPDFNAYLRKLAESITAGLGCPDVAAWDEVQGVARAARLSSEAAVEVDLQLPRLCKMLLLAAYLCSRNKPSVDKRTFTTSGGGRLRGKTGYDRQVAAQQETLLSGRVTFPRERLLAVFWALLQLEGLGGRQQGAMAERGASQKLSGHRDDVRLAADVLSELSTLCSLRFLTQISGDLLEGATYRCELADAAANVLADEMDVKLDRYLFFA